MTAPICVPCCIARLACSPWHGGWHHAVRQPTRRI